MIFFGKMFNSKLHPRIPRGMPGGGRFMKKFGAGWGDRPTKPMPRLPGSAQRQKDIAAHSAYSDDRGELKDRIVTRISGDITRRAESDPELREALDRLDLDPTGGIITSVYESLKMGVLTNRTMNSGDRPMLERVWGRIAEEDVVRDGVLSESVSTVRRQGDWKNDPSSIEGQLEAWEKLGLPVRGRDVMEWRRELGTPDLVEATEQARQEYYSVQQISLGKPGVEPMRPWDELPLDAQNALIEITGKSVRVPNILPPDIEERIQKIGVVDLGSEDAASSEWLRKITADVPALQEELRQQSIYDAVNRMVGTWAGSSYKRPLSRRLQQRVSAKFDIPDEVDQLRRTESRGRRIGSDPETDPIEELTPEAFLEVAANGLGVPEGPHRTADMDTILDAFIESTYEWTQKDLKSRRIDTVMLHRGTSSQTVPAAEDSAAVSVIPNERLRPVAGAIRDLIETDITIEATTEALMNERNYMSDTDTRARVKAMDIGSAAAIFLPEHPEDFNPVIVSLIEELGRTVATRVNEEWVSNGGRQPAKPDPFLKMISDEGEWEELTDAEIVGLMKKYVMGSRSLADEDLVEAFKTFMLRFDDDQADGHTGPELLSDRMEIQATIGRLEARSKELGHARSVALDARNEAVGEGPITWEEMTALESWESPFHQNPKLAYEAVMRGYDLQTKVASSKALMQPISSFSTSPETASGFGNVQIGVEVPRERIFSTTFTGLGSLPEREVVVLGGEMDASVMTKEMDSGRFFFGPPVAKAEFIDNVLVLDMDEEDADWIKHVTVMKAIDGDGDGFVHDGTPQMRPVGPGDTVRRPKAPKPIGSRLGKWKGKGKIKKVEPVAPKIPTRWVNEEIGRGGWQLDTREDYPGVALSAEQRDGVAQAGRAWIDGNWVPLREIAEDLLREDDGSRIDGFADLDDGLLDPYAEFQRAVARTLTAVRDAPKSTFWRGYSLPPEDYDKFARPGYEWSETLSTATGHKTLAEQFSHNTFGTSSEFSDTVGRRPLVIKYSAKNIPVWNPEHEDMKQEHAFLINADERFMSGKYRITSITEDLDTGITYATAEQTDD